jgi:hypothetical protein
MPSAASRLGGAGFDGEVMMMLLTFLELAFVNCREKMEIAGMDCDC